MNLAACAAGKRTFYKSLTIFCRQHTSSPHIHYPMRSLLGFNRINPPKGLADKSADIITLYILRIALSFELDFLFIF